MIGYCFRCGVNKSVFWHRFSYGCDEHGDGGDVFTLCDDCFIAMNRFMTEMMTEKTKGEEEQL